MAEINVNVYDAGPQIDVDVQDVGLQVNVEVSGVGQIGPQGPAGYTPKRGVDYWTDTDKTEIVAATVAALPVYNGEVQGGV